jgi:glycosyltransferase involved in cell wall biosynthesis
VTGARKVRIGYLAGAAGDWGGASRVLFNTIKLLDRERYEPLVLLPRDGPIMPTLDELRVSYRVWGPTRETGRGVVRWLRDVVESMRMLRRERIDLLHVNFVYWRPAEVLAAKLLRIPVVTHYHAVVPRPGPFARLSTAILTVSRFAATVSEPKSVRMAVLHNTVTLARFDAAHDLRAELGLADDDTVIGFIGQIKENKGVGAFIRMAHVIAGDRLKFLIVGECRDPQRFEGSYTEERLRAEIGADARVRYLGYRSDVENVFRTCDLVVVPSRCREAFGLINIEAGAAAKPVVAMRDGGIPEIIRDGENGFLVDVDDFDAMVAAVRRLVDDPTLRRRLGSQARAIVEREFTTGPVRKLEALYDELAGLKGA